MIFYEDEVVAEVRRHREELLEEYGGIKGLQKHMEDERPLLESQGWKFETSEEAIARKQVNLPITSN